MSEIEQPNLAGAAYAVEAETDVYADPVDLTPLIDRLRAGGIDVSVQRIESSEPRTERVLYCPECDGEPQTVTGTSTVLGGTHLRLACGHTVRDWNGAR